MPILTYPYLADAVQIGQPLGCDSTGWPYQIVQVIHIARDDDPELSSTEVALEPWPIPESGASEEERAAYLDAMRHAASRVADRLS